MPRGADDRYWQEQGLPSVFKHTLLDKYVPQFAGMTGSRATARRVVFLDGFTGRGRYQDGSPASAERILRIAQNQGESRTVFWTCFFVEVDGDDAAQLAAVVDQYARQGVTAKAHQGSVLEVLDDVVRTAVGCPLFLFLDPCGLGIPYDRLVTLLHRERPAGWPPTEVLLNFSLEAVRRIAGHVGSERGFEATRRRLDEAVGGDWWRAEFASVGAVTDEAVAAVANRFAEMLASDSDMDIVSVPVHRAPRQKPVYHLVLGTRAQYGLWVFGDSVAQATEAWWATREERTEEDQGRLFPVTQVERPSLETIKVRALAEIVENLVALMTTTPRSGSSTTRSACSAATTARSARLSFVRRSRPSIVTAGRRRPARARGSASWSSSALRPMRPGARASRRRSDPPGDDRRPWAYDRPTA
jgi:three-Cys-motif partner protein